MWYSHISLLLVKSFNIKFQMESLIFVIHKQCQNVAQKVEKESNVYISEQSINLYSLFKCIRHAFYKYDEDKSLKEQHPSKFYTTTHETYTISIGTNDGCQVHRLATSLLPLYSLTTTAPLLQPGLSDIIREAMGRIVLDPESLAPVSSITGQILYSPLTPQDLKQDSATQMCRVYFPTILS